ncbi:MAG TPA: M48 family metalloprotease [Gemmatimonadaceae bacterium]|nr:M48 family metalloprotease [Gemmatimonadaceae bacterium]
MNHPALRPSRRSRRFLSPAARRLLPFALLLAVSTCARNPVTGRRELSLVSESQEIAMGREGAQSVVATMGLVPDSGLQQYVSTLGMRMAKASERPGLPWVFGVIDDPLVNAFALPGGPVFITRGILTHMNSEAQLASVLGHEIGHITAKHSVAQMSQSQLAQLGLGVAMIVSPEIAQFGNLASQGLGLLFLKFGRDDELQADDLGFRYMVQAGYHPSEMAEMFRTLQRQGGGGEGGIPEWLSTHPDPGNRVENTLQRIANASLPSGLTEERDRFLQRTEGLVFGENPRQGFFQGSAFLHPDLRFRLDFPNGWRTVNQTSQVAGVSPEQDAVIVLTLAAQTNPSSALSQFLSQQGIQTRGTSGASINGLPAASAAFLASTQQGVVGGWIAFVQHSGATFQILGYTPQQRLANYDNLLRQSVGSFRVLTDPAALAVKPARLRLVRLPRPMTLTEFNQAYPSSIPLDQLALANGVEPTTRLAAGMLVKRVVVE